MSNYEYELTEVTLPDYISGAPWVVCVESERERDIDFF